MTVTDGSAQDSMMKRMEEVISEQSNVLKSLNSQLQTDSKKRRKEFEDTMQEIMTPLQPGRDADEPERAQTEIAMTGGRER